MTKQEYDSSKYIIISDKKLGQTNRSKELLYLADEYIKSLEQEIERLNRIIANSVSKMELDTCRSLNDALREDNVRLRKDNQALVEQVNAVGRKLENAIEILGDLGIRNCPMLTVNGYDCSNGKGCKHYHENTPTDTYACWTAYFEGWNED